MVRIGVCGNAGGRAQPRDIEAARMARAEIYKAMSHGDPREVDWVRAFNPGILIILRLYIGGLDRRRVAAEQAARDWEHDLRQWYDKGVRDVEVHNEPNLRDEGWLTNWIDGREFALWWLGVVGWLRPRFPGVRWGFPGLSPGFGFEGRAESTAFLTQADAAVRVADFLCWHCYYTDEGSLRHPAAGFSWQEPHRRYPGKPLHITEYSNPDPAVSFADKARQARLYAEALAAAPVLSAAYFCTGGDSFPHQVMWNAAGSTGIAEELGRRVMIAAPEPPGPTPPPVSAEPRRMVVLPPGVNVRRQGDKNKVFEKLPAGQPVDVFGEGETVDGWDDRVYLDPPRRHVWAANLGPVPDTPPVDRWRIAAEALLAVFGRDRDVLITMLAIGASESAQFTQDRGDFGSGDPRYHCDGYASFGVWQVYAPAHFDKYQRLTGSTDPCVWYQWTHNWRNAAAIAKAVLDASSYGAWSVFKNGAYRTHLERATAVIDALLAETEPPPVTPEPPVAVGWVSPVGDAESLGPDGLWMAQAERGRWFDANPYGRRYTDSAGNAALHTGADLNWNPPGQWDADADQAVKAIGAGTVRYASRINAAWSNVVIVEHDLAPDGRRYVARYAHLGRIDASAGGRVERGQQLGTVGAPGGGPNHLHLDISPTDVLLNRPGDWPGLDRARLERDYLPPRDVLAANKRS